MSKLVDGLLYHGEIAVGRADQERIGELVRHNGHEPESDDWRTVVGSFVLRPAGRTTLRRSSSTACQPIARTAENSPPPPNN